jgi:hypothetical protein
VFRNVGTIYFIFPASQGLRGADRDAGRVKILPLPFGEERPTMDLLAALEGFGK